VVVNGVVVDVVVGIVVVPRSTVEVEVTVAVAVPVVGIVVVPRSTVEVEVTVAVAVPVSVVDVVVVTVAVCVAAYGEIWRNEEQNP
jgi:hypothetical protein